MTVTAHGEFNSATGDKGEVTFASLLPHGWIWQPPRKDLGKDGIVVVRDGSDLHNFEFGIQIKTTLSPEFIENKVVVRGISRSSVLYWHMSAYPTLIVVVHIIDDERKEAWYAWHYELFKSVGGYFDPSGKESLVLKVPSDNRLDRDGWNAIRTELKRSYLHLYNSLGNANAYVHLAACINLLSTIAKTLLIASDSRITKAQDGFGEGWWLLLEEYQHMKVLFLFERLIDANRRNEEHVKTLCGLRDSYLEIACKVFPSIATATPLMLLSDYPPHKDHVCVTSLLLESRNTLISIVLDLIKLATGFGSSESDELKGNPPKNHRSQK